MAATVGIVLRPRSNKDVVEPPAPAQPVVTKGKTSKSKAVVKRTKTTKGAAGNKGGFKLPIRKINPSVTVQTK